MFICFLAAALMFRGSEGVTVVLPPRDTARPVGANVTLACVVTNRQTSESVQWKYKPSGSDAFNALTFNENVFSDPSKYSLQWTYNLTIAGLKVSDSGLYRCSTGGQDYDATLTVVDLPNNVSIAWSGEPINGDRVNLTCTAEHGMPPPQVRWLINGVDMTASAIVENTTSNTANGYSDVVSYLPLSLDTTMNGRGAECIVSYQGWDNAMKAVYTIQTKFPGGYSNLGGFSDPDTVIFGQPLSSNNSSGSLIEGGGGMAGKPGMFLLRFLKESGGEKIDVELQQYSP